MAVVMSFMPSELTTGHLPSPPLNLISAAPRNLRVWAFVGGLVMAIALGLLEYQAQAFPYVPLCSAPTPQVRPYDFPSCRWRNRFRDMAVPA